MNILLIIQESFRKLPMFKMKRIYVNSRVRLSLKSYQYGNETRMLIRLNNIKDGLEMTHQNYESILIKG